MHDRTIVVNTTPLNALSAHRVRRSAFSALRKDPGAPRGGRRDSRRWPAGGPNAPGFRELSATPDFDVQAERIEIPAYLANALDNGEAAVVATALTKGIRLVCIDEIVGRRLARMAGLDLTGSIGILIKAKRLGFAVEIRDAVNRMRKHGNWLSAAVITAALAAANEE